MGNFLTVLSLIATLISLFVGVASYISIYYKVEQKDISKNKFICLVALVLFAICLITLIISLNIKNEKDNTLNDMVEIHTTNEVFNNKTTSGTDFNNKTFDSETSPITTSCEETSNNTTSNYDKNISTTIENKTTVIPTTKKPEEKPTEEVTEPYTEIINGILKISPIKERNHKVEPIKDSTFKVSSIEILKFSGNISSNGQKDDYKFIPKVSGRHRFEFSNVPNGTDLRLRIYNSGWELLESDYDLDNGDGLYLSLMSGETYFIRVEQYENVGPYTLNIGPKKDIIDISNVTSLSDSIQYKNQTNDYFYIPKVSGRHRFEFSNVPNGTDLRLRIYNSGWELLESDYDLDNGDGLYLSLTSGETYYIEVEQYENVGPYTLNIGTKKSIIDISNVTSVSDSIEYTNQTNDYSYIPKVNGKHRFEFSNVPNGTDLRLRIYNSGWELLESNYDLDNGDGLSIFLKKEETYYIEVEQYENIGSYTLNIGQKKETINITDNPTVSDNIQYTDQENDYLFLASDNAKYKFYFSDVKNDCSLFLGVYNSGWEKINSNNDIKSNGGFTVLLNKGESYFIQVAQYKGYGNYTLIIEKQDD